MHKIVKTRIIVACISIASVSIGVALLLYAMSDSIVFFYAPSKLPTTMPQHDFRIGGMVKTGSIIKRDDGATEFIVTDFVKDIKVHYSGIIPVLFRDGQGVVIKGAMNSDEVFIATELLAKHDEKYMPKS